MNQSFNLISHFQSCLLLPLSKSESRAQSTGKFSGSPAISVVVLALMLLITPVSVSVAQVAADRAVQVAASVQKIPPQITLNWIVDPNGASYTISRRLAYPPPPTTVGGVTISGSSSNPWNEIATLSNAGTYTDTNISAGQAYEYQVAKSSSVTTGTGYIVSGIEVPAVESRGKIILIIDNTFAADLVDELTALEMDLIGDGWSVIRHDVSRSDTPPNVKALIQNDYNADKTNTNAVLLFGHVPVPYSGFLNPDGHWQHFGAWPADVYYGDMTGTWTDTQDYRNQWYYQQYGGSSDPRQINVPGDGKFDQTTIPGPVALEIGRVDLSNMPSFAPKTELDLLRQYLNKDHAYRNALTTQIGRGLIDDNFGYFSYGEAFAASGWRNFPPFVSAGNLDTINVNLGQSWVTTLSAQPYLLAYGCGPGWNSGAGGVATTSDYAAYDPKAVFTMLFGSFFGDWDVGDNLLRAPLATTRGLTNAWAGRPHWFVHHMGLGETVGYGARLTQNNGGNDYWPANSWYTNMIHIALMGDPTLRLYPIAPASDLWAYPTQVCTTTAPPRNCPACRVTVCQPAVGLSWTRSPDSSVIGYNLYKTDALHPAWTRVNQQPITANSYTDSAYFDTQTSVLEANYMLRAIKLQTTPSGTYYDMSQAAFATTYQCDLPNSLWGCGPGPF